MRLSGFVGSSLVGFFSLLVFFTFMSQFYAFWDCPGVCHYEEATQRERATSFRRSGPIPSCNFFELASYFDFESGLVDSSFLDFFKVFFAMSLFSLSSCPSGAHVVVMCNCGAILCEMVQVS